jgi:hypothetical protein
MSPKCTAFSQKTTPRQRSDSWQQLLPASFLGDDRFGCALDRLYRADRASLLTALVVHAVPSAGSECRTLA